MAIDAKPTSTVAQLVPMPALPADPPDRLRQLADDVESGRVTSLVAAYVLDDNHVFLWPLPLSLSLILATLLQSTAVDRFRV